MRSRTPSKTSSRTSNFENSQVKPKPHFSRAFIWSLARQLSSSTSKEAMNPASTDEEVGHQLIEDSTQMNKASERKQRCSQQRSQTQLKKQVKRRLHTTKPYQERPINMAEARREIVAALKFHRAKMKQSSQQQKQNSLSQPKFQTTSPSLPMMDSSMGMKYWQPTFNTFQTKALPYNCVNCPSFQSISHPPNFSWSSTSASLVPFSKPINLSLPDHPLGLHLKLHDFEELETIINDDNCLSFSLSSSVATTSASSSSLSSSSSYSCSSATMFRPELPSFPVGPFGTLEATSNLTVDSLHLVLGEREMAEIHYIGDQHEMEWNDNLNLVQSAWWEKFLKTMDTGSQCQEQRIAGGDGIGVSDEISSCPPWTPGQQLLNDLGGEEGSFEDACLPCLGIEDIEGMDGEWLL